MAVSEQPARYTRWATDGGADVVEPGEGAKDVGFVELTAADEATFNWLGRNDYEWQRHLDERSLGYEYTGRDASWIEDGFGYTGAANTALLTAVPGVVWLEGKRLDLSLAYLDSIGQDQHTFTISNLTYIAVNADRELWFGETSAIGPPPAPTPPAGYTLVLYIHVTPGSPPAITYLLPTTPMLDGPLSVAGDIPIIARGDDIVAGDFGHSNWGSGPAGVITVAANSKQSAGSISMAVGGTGLDTATPQIVFTFPTPYEEPPHGIVVRRGGTGTTIDRFDFTFTETTLTIDAVGGSIGGDIGNTYQLAWMIQACE